MTYLLDNLPLDMILYEIFPYLDYNSRVTANAMLPPQDRVGTPLRKDAAIQVAIWIAVARLSRALKAQERGRTDSERVRGIIAVYKLYNKRFFFILQYNSKLRQVFMEKTASFANPLDPQYEMVSTYSKKTLTRLCQESLTIVEEKYPFIRDITSLACETWSAIA